MPKTLYHTYGSYLERSTVCWTRGWELPRRACYLHVRTISRSQTTSVTIPSHKRTHKSCHCDSTEHGFLFKSFCFKNIKAFAADTGMWTLAGAASSLFLFLTLAKVRLAGTVHPTATKEPGSQEAQGTHTRCWVPGQLAILTVSEETKALL